jgi:hypothetical protein
MTMAEEMVETEVETVEIETPLDTDEPTTEQSLDADLDALYEEHQDTDVINEEVEIVDEAETADVEEKPVKVVLTRREKEALKHADMTEAVEGMEPSAVKAFAKKLATERSAKDKLASEKGELQKQLEAKELAESEEFDIDSDENEYLPEEAKDAFKAQKTQLAALQERLDTLEQGSDTTVERFWDKLDSKQYPQYVEGDDVEELRSEIEGDAKAFRASQPGMTHADALTKCLQLATIDDQIKASVAREVAKKIRKKRGGITPKIPGGSRLPATGTSNLDEDLDALYDAEMAKQGA